MSRYSTPRGTARAIRRGNAAPSLGFVPSHHYVQCDDFVIELEWDDYDARARYRDLREEGYSREQALLMSGLADPDSL